MKPSRRAPVPLALLLCAVLAALAAWAAWAASAASAAAAEPLSRKDRIWVEKTFATMDLEAKAAQMLMVRANAVPRHPDSPEQLVLREQVAKLAVGGVVLFRSELDTIPLLLDELQSAAKIPLWIGADVERSLGMRVPTGPVSLPDAMAIGAIPGEAGIAAARFAGELTARESRAAGMHWAFAPVADVNVNPANPVINLRSFGEDPARVGQLVTAFVEGARAGGVLTAVKHFPGHGDTTVDSHFELPSITSGRDRLDRIELAPFRAAIAAGVDSVMVGHLAVPALDPEGTAASLSKAITTDLLRGELGFQGLVVSDALDMNGIGGVWMGEAAVRAVMAGADVVLLPPDPRVAIQSLVRAVEEGRLAESRLDASVRRILESKARLGLHRERQVDRARLRYDVGRPADSERADEIARRAITVVRNEGGIVPLRAEEPLHVLHLVLSSDWIHSNAGPGGGIIGDELEARGVEIETRRLGPGLSPAAADTIVADAHGFTHVLVSTFVRVTSADGNADMDSSHSALLERLAAAGAKLVVISLGSPYLLTEFPHAPAYVCTFSPEESSQRAAVAALFGEHAVGGRLPVTIPGLYRLGEGLEVPRRALELQPSSAAEAGFRAAGLAAVDRLIERFIQRQAFPSAVIAIGHQGRLAHLKAFGRLTYDERASPTTTETVYDIASLTKVVVTTSAAMMMVDQGRLDLDSPVQTFLPRFVGPNKEKVTVRHLLTHSSGIDWWAPLYRELHGKQAFLERIYAMDVVSVPGTQTKYSDLGVLLLGEILERVSGGSLDQLARERLFEPLGLRHTGYRPGPELRSQIAPTENDPARGVVVHGTVHDENAAALGGIAPHAGLFSTAGDLARFAQMLLWKGAYDHHRILRRSTVEQFTRAADLPVGSSRALGWDTKSPSGSSAGTLFSPGSFGHTGFTGTSIWIDPARDLFVVLLTNRVHPTRDNSMIREARPAIHDAVVRALVDAPPVVRAGLDRVDAGAVELLAGKRLGLLTHAAAVTLDGRNAVEVFQEQGLQVVRLFSPEHGIGGHAAAGETIANGVDPTSGLPIVSLYGAQRKPTRADLAGLDALVVDLQDAGVRFYTYSSTLLLALEAAAEAGIELIVLDRPNPLGGERVAGPPRATVVEVPPSFLSMAPGPLVHGLTLGELARFANARRESPAQLTVIPMDGWQRAMTWQATGRAWSSPSPNLRSAEAAIAYPGLALLEATNVSEGRGTATPFLVFGAPWLDPAKVAVDVPGFRLTVTRFTPHASPAAPEPKYRDQECVGFQVEVVDPAIADPWALGLELLAALSRQSGFEWLRGGQALTTLLGSPMPGELLRAGRSPLGEDAAALASWRAERRPALLYD